MSGATGFLPRLTDLVAGAELTPALASSLAAIALMQAHIAAEALHETIIPSLAPAKRGLATDIARRLGTKRFFRNDLVRDLETLIASLGVEIDNGTHPFWHGDDNHVRGGYRSVFVEPGATALAEAKGDIVMLRDTVLAALSAAHALHDAGFQFD
ncbi:hypothetical protein GE300_13395 [Rhodobacteraceae bacterium 2CG4]|uniref:Uncharacterized protein n=1 Tax=Halovulum marinum TaxID=2662447 RepID=A0A6L5Z263_9RHOB|nr:hypothetical protein [Halovulum marinum]MSU90598.1 hypothetical protein [Halovulum marinum]